MSAKEINTWLDRRGSLLLGVLGFIVTAVVAVFAISAYTANSEQHEQINTQSKRLTRSLCASANTTASAFREPAVGESDAHFADRLLAQRKTLRYSFGLGCSNIKGFEELPRKRRDALDEIDHVLALLGRDSGDESQPEDITQALRRAVEDGSVDPSTLPDEQPSPSPSPSSPDDPSSGGSVSGGSNGSTGGSSDGVDDGGIDDGSTGDDGGSTGPVDGGTSGLLPDSPLGPIQVPGLDCHVTALGIRVCD